MIVVVMTALYNDNNDNRFKVIIIMIMIVVIRVMVLLSRTRGVGFVVSWPGLPRLATSFNSWCCFMNKFIFIFGKSLLP